MEKFSQHIEKLLAQHDYVVVPDLGGFVVQLQSAELLPDRIFPPLDTIGFNPLMHHADGLLAIEIARSEKISYRLAMEYIEKQVESIKIRLDSNKAVQIGKLGFLSLDNSGTIIFSPDVKADLLPQNFGLSDLYISTRDQILDKKPRKIIITLPTSRSYKYVAAAMLIFGLFFAMPHVSDIRQSDYANLTPTIYHNSAASNSGAPATTINPKTEKAPEKPTPDIIKKYHVVVACLPSQKSADKFCSELIKKDFKEAHVLPPTKKYRVAILSFSDKKQAIEFMENLRKSKTGFDTAWVLCH